MSSLLGNVEIDGLLTGSGILIRSPVAVATTQAQVLSSDFVNGSVIDGYTLVTGNRILIKDQVSQVQNGIYVVQASGTPLRADDLQTGWSALGISVTVLNGTINYASVWTCVSYPTAVLDTDNIIFSRSDVSGTAGNILSVVKGGTGLSSLTNGTFLTASSTTTFSTVKAVPSGTVVGTSDFQTLTNKNIDTITNIFDSAGSSTKQISFNLAELSTPRTVTFPDFTDTIVMLTAAQTITNKTLTSPIINQINDANNNSALIINPTMSSVNQLTITNASAGTSPVLSTTGTDTDINLILTAKGAGTYNLTSSSSTTSELRLFQANSSSQYIGLKASTSLSSGVTFILPSADGTAGQVLTTDGSKNLSFTTRLNRNSYTICTTQTTVSNSLTTIATSQFPWMQTEYGIGGTSPYSSGKCIYIYTSNAAGVGLTLTVNLVDTTSAVTLATDSFTIPSATSGTARSFTFTLPTSDAQIQISVVKSASTGIINLCGANLEFAAV